MTSSELKDQVTQDLKLQIDQLDIEARRTPDIHNIYSKMLMSERIFLKKLERDLKVLRFEKWEYYTKKASPEVYEEKPLLKKILTTDVKVYLDADPDILELQAKIDDKEETVDFLKRTLDQIAQRTWLIRNAIEYVKFQNGGASNWN
jgi:hypothetical protein